MTINWGAFIEEFHSDLASSTKCAATFNPIIEGVQLTNESPSWKQQQIKI
jgi:hypothetical protein